MKTSLLTGLLALALGSCAIAAPITIYNTGANGPGVDPNYRLTYSDGGDTSVNSSVVAMANTIWGNPLPGSK